LPAHGSQERTPQLYIDLEAAKLRPTPVTVALFVDDVQDLVSTPWPRSRSSSSASGTSRLSWRVGCALASESLVKRTG